MCVLRNKGLLGFVPNTAKDFQDIGTTWDASKGHGGRLKHLGSVWRPEHVSQQLESLRRLENIKEQFCRGLRMLLAIVKRFV